MKKLGIFLLLLIFALSINAQNENERAKAYYFAAEEQYSSRNYSKVIEYCGQIEELLGGTNARIEALRLKSYYNNGNTQRAKESLDLFLSLNADESLLKEMALYITKIEDAEKERIRKEKEVNEARVRKEQEEVEARSLLLKQAIFNEDGTAIVKSGGKFGIIDAQGNTVIPFEYDYAEPFSNGISLVSRNGLKGYIDTKGAIVIPLEYEEIGTTFNEEAITWFRVGNNYGMIDIVKGEVFRVSLFDKKPTNINDYYVLGGFYFSNGIIKDFNDLQVNPIAMQNALIFGLKVNKNGRTDKKRAKYFYSKITSESIWYELAQVIIKNLKDK